VKLIIENNKREIKHATFYPQLQDRLILITDGITQAGMGSDKFPFGWERDRVVNFISKTLETEPIISAQKLAQRIVNMANKLDDYQPKDDMTCGVIYFRKPRKVLVVTGPPFEEKMIKKWLSILMILKVIKLFVELPLPILLVENLIKNY